MRPRKTPLRMQKHPLLRGMMPAIQRLSIDHILLVLPKEVISLVCSLDGAQSPQWR
jgi:hypothetical protein